MLSNLLTNAAKYTDSPGRISLTARVEDAHAAHLRQGQRHRALAGAALADIFKMFSQVQDVACGRTEGGLGIGLALVKGLVDSARRHIEAFSEGTGHGSEFVVTLPCRRVEHDTAGRGRSHDGNRRRAIGCRKILVADDNQDAANTLAMLLRLAGHDVRTAHGGEAALTVASTFEPEIALLDIGMPDLERLRSREAIAPHRLAARTCGSSRSRAGGRTRTSVARARPGSTTT